MKKRIRAKAVCSSCGGTGLYSGMAESENCAVACTTCDGTGCEIIDVSYTPFTKRRKTNKIKRVFSGSCGYKHSADDVTTKEGVTIKFSQAGCTYDEWLKGAKPKPVKELYCPYLWTGQRLQCSGEDKNGLYKNYCSRLNCGGMISNCPKYSMKEECWAIYEGAKK